MYVDPFEIFFEVRNTLSNNVSTNHYDIYKLQNTIKMHFCKTIFTLLDLV